MTGSIYINDFTDICLPYCFNYSTFDIALNGLVGISKRMHIQPPKSFDTFIRQVEQFTVYAANSTLGATGFADVFIVAAHFVDKIRETGKDGHIEVHDIETYLSEKIRSFIYTLNWEFRGNQSPFTNISIFDKYFLESLVPNYVFMDTGKAPSIESVQLLQRIYLDAMNEELERSPLTFNSGKVLNKKIIYYFLSRKKKNTAIFGGRKF